MSDRAERSPADLADALGDRVGHGEELLGLFVEQQVVVAKVRATHVPVKVLGLQVQREDIGQDCIRGAGEISRGTSLQIGRRGKRRVTPLLEFDHLGCVGRLHHVLQDR